MVAAYYFFFDASKKPFARRRPLGREKWIMRGATTAACPAALPVDGRVRARGPRRGRRRWPLTREIHLCISECFAATCTTGM